MISLISKGLRTQSWLSPVVIVLLVLPTKAGAQLPAPSQEPKPMAPLATVRSLKVIPLAGNGEMNDLERRVMAPLVIQVLDQNSRPVEGADVVFRFPVQGPSAAFQDQKNSKTVKTNPDGQAAATGWMANNEVGTFKLQVSASRGNELGETTVSMTNVTRIVNEGKGKHKSWWSSKWAKIGVIGGAAAVVAVVVLVNRGGSTAQPTVITGIPGSPTIGGR